MTAILTELMIQKLTFSSRRCSSPILPEQLRTRSAGSSNSEEFADPFLTCNNDEKAVMTAMTARLQHQLDRMDDLNNGGFLALRGRMENEYEAEIRNTGEVARTGCEGHPQGQAVTRASSRILISRV